MAVTLVGGLWWAAALRLALWPQSAGVIEGAVVAGGWGLSLLPVHCVPRVGQGNGRNGRGGWLEKGRAGLAGGWRRWRSGGGNGGGGL
ncbi:hypothetical protein [Streptomyces halobius]|uniref:Secreted protein n=1 Tax=Streptomyces halobius TaxID=2879846 RepID=A0ABY4MJ84_9ACTN|nr:hypothetical protein [Streptomyces halobius]UQA97737.1 hypothetical protein K9S39_13635 [Streptomyces halobius]